MKRSLKPRLLSTSACQVFVFNLQRTGEVFPSCSLSRLAVSHRGCRYKAVADDISLRGQSAATFSTASLELTPCRLSLPCLADLRRLRCAPCRNYAGAAAELSLILLRFVTSGAAADRRCRSYTARPSRHRCRVITALRVVVVSANSLPLHYPPVLFPSRSRPPIPNPRQGCAAAAARSLMVDGSCPLPLRRCC